MAKIYEFAIKKNVLNSGKTILTPVCRIKSKLGRFNIFPNEWLRITNIYDQYILMELDWIPELTYKECELHIKGYQQILFEKIQNEVSLIQFDTLEEKKI